MHTSYSFFIFIFSTCCCLLLDCLIDCLSITTKSVPLGPAPDFTTNIFHLVDLGNNCQVEFFGITFHHLLFEHYNVEQKSQMFQVRRIPANTLKFAKKFLNYQQMQYNYTPISLATVSLAEHNTTATTPEPELAPTEKNITVLAQHPKIITVKPATVIVPQPSKPTTPVITYKMISLKPAVSISTPVSIPTPKPTVSIHRHPQLQMHSVTSLIFPHPFSMVQIF